MASSLVPDPMQLWRDALTRLENGANALAADGMKSHRLVRTLHALAAASRMLQQIGERLADEGVHRLNLPTRQDVAELAQALRRIEDKLDLLLPSAAIGAAAPHPARTRRPPAPTPRRPAQPSAATSAPPRRATKQRKDRGPAKV